VEFNEVTRAYFQRSAPLRPGQLGNDLSAAIGGKADAAAAIQRLSSDPWFNAQMRTTCTATMISGGHAPNALPQTATANINCRRLPGLETGSVVKLLTKLIADPNVLISVRSDWPQSPPSPLRGDVEAAVRGAAEAIAPGLPLVPSMDTGATDGLYFRNAGIPTYGLTGIAIDVDDVRAHGRDERISVVSFERGQEFAYRLLKALAAPGVTP
jgi:acetylornithine deacetylase/succinyl-diaminopimelate desuccinylase-like protein